MSIDLDKEGNYSATKSQKPKELPDARLYRYNRDGQRQQVGEDKYKLNIKSLFIHFDPDLSGLKRLL